MNSIYGALKLLSELSEAHFHGKVEIELEGGRVVRLQKTETVKAERHSSRSDRGRRDA